jgi:hypothetical protein
MKDQIQFLTGIVRTLTDFLVSVAIVVLMVDILFPDAGLPIVENIAVLVEGISSEGLAGLVALLLFFMFYRQNQSPAAGPSSPPSQGGAENY